MQSRKIAIILSIEVFMITSCYKNNWEYRPASAPVYKLNQFDTVDKVFFSGYGYDSSNLFEIVFTKNAYSNGNSYDSPVAYWTIYQTPDTISPPPPTPYHIQYLLNSPLIIFDSLKSIFDGNFMFAAGQNVINKPFMRSINTVNDSVFITFVLSPGAQLAIPSVAQAIPLVNDTTEVPLYNSFITGNYLTQNQWAYYPAL
jgi:hypothetical protein